MRALIKIGDERYPSEFGDTMLLPPGRRKLVARLGHINARGIYKIRTAQYVDNTVQLELVVEARSIGSRRMKRVLNERYQIDASGPAPVFLLLPATSEPLLPATS